jgi:hypothetical protein
MIALLILILVLVVVSLTITVAFMAHELGWFPHTKDRSSPAIRVVPFRSRYESDVAVTHGSQFINPFSRLLREHAHADVYGVSDPEAALRNVINRYREQPTRSRYDDLVHVANYVCNHVRCDDRVNELIDQIHQLMHSMPAQAGS